MLSNEMTRHFLYFVSPSAMNSVVFVCPIFSNIYSVPNTTVFSLLSGILFCLFTLIFITGTCFLVASSSESLKICHFFCKFMDGFFSFSQLPIAFQTSFL